MNDTHDTGLWPLIIERYMPEKIFKQTGPEAGVSTGSPPLPVETVSSPVELADALREISGSGVIALDTETDNFYRYPERLCLVQIATRDKVYLIDTIALDELTPLRNLLEDNSIEKIIHAADNDIRTLDRHCGFHVRNVFDTSIAARFTGITRLSLGTLIGDLLGISMNKSKRLQRADWGRRPLSTEALHYAASDVRHLHDLRAVLVSHLDTLGRTAWVTEECVRLEEIRYTPPDMENAYLSVKGTKDLDERGLTVLKSLYLSREKEARRRHRPVFMVLPDAVLVSLAGSPEMPLSEVPGLSGPTLKRYGQGIQKALREGMAAPLISRPRRAVSSHTRNNAKNGKNRVRRLNRLKEWRVSIGSSLSLDPSLIWPLASLERLAGAPGNLSTELTSDEIRQWQRDVFTSSLEACLESLQ